MSDVKYKNYLDRWKNQDWKAAGERTAKTVLKSYQNWFHKLPKNILDVGCMNGYVTDALNRMGYDTWGVEPNDFGEAEFYEKIFRAKIQDVISFAYKFDLVICFEVMEHIPERDIIPSLKAIRNNMDGVAFFTISEDKKADPTHITIHNREWWLDKMKRTGFTYHPEKQTMKGFNFYCLT